MLKVTQHCTGHQRFWPRHLVLAQSPEPPFLGRLASFVMLMRSEPQVVLGQCSQVSDLNSPFSLSVAS